MGVCRHRMKEFDDFLFINPLEFDKNKAQTNTLSAPTSFKRKDNESLQSGIGKNNVRSANQEKNPLFHEINA